MDGLEHLHIIHGMCILELQHLMDNIVIFERKSTNILREISDAWRDITENADSSDLAAYDTFCSTISEVTKLARKFNLHFRMHNLGSDDPPELNGGPLKDAANCKVLRSPQISNYYQQQYILPVEENDSDVVAPKVSVSPTEKPKLNGFANDSTSVDEENSSVSELSVDSWNSLPAYAKKDLSIYKEGSEITATVSYIQNLKQLRFFICEAGVENISAEKIAQLSKMKHLVQYGPSRMPPKKTIFGLVLDDVIVRALRLDRQKNKSKMQALLLDLGEVVSYSNRDIMYQLSAEYQKLPAQAIPCVLHTNSKNNRNKLQAQLESWKYQTLKLRVVKNYSKILHVKYLADVINSNSLNVDDKAYEDGGETSCGEILTNGNEICSNGNDVCNNGNEICTNGNEICSNGSEICSNGNEICSIDSIKFDYTQLPLTNPFREDLINQMKKNVPTDTSASSTELSSLSSATSGKLSSNDLTSEQLEILYEETPCTSNAMKAVIGYEPKDERRVCRFYNPKTKSCFKGANCRQEHTLLPKDSWTKDVVPAATIFDERMPDTIYAAGTIINITPTYIGDLERFYCQINDGDYNSEPIIFTDEDIQEAGAELRSPPLIFDLVLSRYQDGLWYRAKIMEVDDACRMFKVFYVDYGNHETVPLVNLAKCDYETAKWPYQAVFCRLADVNATTLTPEKRKAGINALRTSVLNRQLDVRVVFHHEELLVRIIDARFKDLTKRLIEMGYFKPFK